MRRALPRELLGRKSVAGTGGNPVALSGVTDVVGVPGTSPVGGGPDVVLAAPGADREATQEVVRGVRATKRAVVLIPVGNAQSRRDERATVRPGYRLRRNPHATDGYRDPRPPTHPCAT